MTATLLFFKRIALLCLYLLFYQDLQAQTYSFWPFQSGAIDFSTDPPTPINKYYDNHTGGPMLSVADSAGKLLFYSDRTFIFNRYNKVMDSAGFLHLMNPRQGMVAFPSLQNNGNYIFVFCGEATHGTVDLDWKKEDVLTLGYYEIDPKLDNDSGNVTHKRFYTILKKPFSKITLVKQENNKGYWLVGRYLENLYAFPYTKDGFGAPVITKIGSVNLYGNLKASHDGKYFVECSDSTIYHYDFDLKTGEFSNEELVDQFQQKAAYNRRFYAYDAAFSPNDSLFYVIDIKRTSSRVSIIQYQRFVKDKQSAKKELFLQDYYTHKIYRDSKDTIGKDTSVPWGYDLGNFISGIQLAPNGKMYFVCAPNAYNSNTQQSYLGEITYPNRISFDCKINPRAYPISIYPAGLIGLPFAMYTPGKFPRFSYTLDCDKIYLKNESHTDFKKFTWYFSDEDSSYKTDLSAVEHQYKKAGKFRVRLKAEMPNGYTSWFSDSVYFIPNSLKTIDFAATDSTKCQYTASQFKAQIVRDTVNKKTGATFIWDFGDGTSKFIVRNDSTASHIYTKTGTFKVTLDYYNGFCHQQIFKDKAIYIIPAPKPGFSVSQTEGCAPLNVQITDKAEGNIIKRWYDMGNGTIDSSANPTAIYTNPGKYLIIQNLISPNGCHTQHKKYITVYKGFTSSDSVSLLNVSVENNFPYMVWSKNASVKNYIIHRQADNENLFTQTAVLNNQNFYTDSTADVQNHSYQYILAAQDSCGNMQQKGRAMQTIHLQATEIETAYILLSWNSFSGWPNGLQDYSVFSHNDNDDWQLLINRKDTLHQQADYYTDYRQTQACYFVQANSKNDTLKSLSNSLCLPLKPVLWIPNAFTPNNDGINDAFRIKAIGITDFEIFIINRWNVTVFHTKNIAEGWDGTYKGNALPQGEYIYIIKAKAQNDQVIYKRGGFTLLEQ